MRLACADLVIGFDTEFVRVDVSENVEIPSEVRDRASDIRSGNHVLCYSVSFYQPSTGVRKSGIIYTEGAGPKHRLAFNTFIAKAIHVAVADGMLDRKRVDAATSKNRLKLVICAHFSRADLPGFRNFDALKKKFDGVRKTYTTIGNPYVLSVKPWRRKEVLVKGQTMSAFTPVTGSNGTGAYTYSISPSRQPCLPASPWRQRRA